MSKKILITGGPGTGKTQILGARIGKILIETNELFDTDGVTIIGYTHNITFENGNFSNWEAFVGTTKCISARNNVR